MNLNEGTENVPRLGFNRLRYLQQFYDSFTRLQFGILVSHLSVLAVKCSIPCVEVVFGWLGSAGWKEGGLFVALSACTDCF